MPTLDQKRQFCSLTSSLSPENLMCDGEISQAEGKRKYAALMKQWRALEAEVGHTVSEDETYGWYEEIDRAARAERAAVMAAQPKHALLEQNNPGVWSRKGTNTTAAYYIWGPGHSGRETYSVYSEFNRFLNKRELVAEGLADLNEAVAAGEALLLTVTAESMRTAAPLYREENIQRELNRLPKEYLDNATA